MPPTSGPQLFAAGPVVSDGLPSARRGPGLEIQGPQCAFETSMFMCPAVHMSTRNLLRSSSTHEPSDPPFRVVMFCHSDRHHRTGPLARTMRAGRGRATCDHNGGHACPRPASSKAPHNRSRAARHDQFVPGLPAARHFRLFVQKLCARTPVTPRGVF